jgi:hypothetical protein
METPSSGSNGPSPGPAPTDSSAERGDRDVVAFLVKEVLPTRGHRISRALRDAVREAVREQRLAPLERLSGRHRRELLRLLELVTESHRRSAAPILVRLTSVISAIPAAPEPVEVSAARPAR